MRTLLKISITILLIFTLGVYALAEQPKTWEESLPAPPTFVLNFQVVVPDNFDPQNKDSVELIEKLVVTVGQLKSDLELKSVEIGWYKQKVAELENLNKLSEQQIVTANKVIQNQDSSLNLLREKIDNLEKIISNYEKANTNLQKQVKNEKRIGNVKVVVTAIALLCLKFL